MTTEQTSRAAAMEPSTAVQVGDLTIDPETGELLGTPTTADEDQVTYLTRMCAAAQRAIKEQEAVYNATRAALLRILAESGRPSVKTAHGTPTLRQQTRRSGRPDRVLDAVRRYELSRDQEQVIWQTATGLDAKELDALAEAGVLPADAVADIVETKAVSFVQLLAARSTG
jgi:hypothetical protein